MGRILVCLLVAVGGVGVLGAQNQEQGQGQPSVFRGGSEIVRAFVTVTDKDGRLVTTLRKEDFELRDEGKPQPISIFDNTPRAIRLIVMLDVSGSMRGNLSVLRNGTAQLVKYLRPDDRARIGTFGKDVVISPTFTRDAGELLAALPAMIDEQAPTPLWRAIDTAMESFSAADGDARNVVLVLSDGADSGPMIGGRFVSQGEVIDRARRRDVMIYAVGMRSRGRPTGGFGPGGLQAALMADMPDPGLAKVGEETGGGYVEINLGDNLGLAFAQVADELHSQYLLGFDPPKRDGKVHDIQIRVSQSGLKPRARRNYLAPKG
jgi:Ca-activated chloride channel family protein